MSWQYKSCPHCGWGLVGPNLCGRCGDISRFLSQEHEEQEFEEEFEPQEAKIKKIERQRDLEKLRSKVSELQANTSETLRSISEIQLKKKERDEDWERQYGKGVVASVGHPFRKGKVVHKEDR